MGKKREESIGRRSFLKGAAGGGAALVASAPLAGGQSGPGPTAAEPREGDATPGGRPGSDFMVDVLKPLGFEYMSINPHSSSRGLQESIINYSGNRDPELITCLHAAWR